MIERTIRELHDMEEMKGISWYITDRPGDFTDWPCCIWVPTRDEPAQESVLRSGENYVDGKLVNKEVFANEWAWFDVFIRVAASTTHESYISGMERLREIRHSLWNVLYYRHNNAFRVSTGRPEEPSGSYLGYRWPIALRVEIPNLISRATVETVTITRK